MKTILRTVNVDITKKLSEEQRALLDKVRDAVIYYTIVKEVLGQEWLSNEFFRLGTSRLANLCLSEILGENVKFF